jgi:hypothetical protein
VDPPVVAHIQPVPPPAPPQPAPPPTPPPAPAPPTAVTKATGPRHQQWDAFYVEERNLAVARSNHPVQSYFNTFTGFRSAPPGYAAALSLSTTRSFTNPLRDPAVAKVLPERFEDLKTKSTTARTHFDEALDYFCFVPKKLVDDYGSKPSGSKPRARVSLFFGVKPEINLFGLRSWFAPTDDSVLICIPGIEAGWPEFGVAWGIGITTDKIDELLNASGLSGIAFDVEVMAGYSTGYRGVNLTVINKLLDLSKLRRLAYLDAFYDHDDHPVAPASNPFHKMNTMWAGATVLAANATAEIVIYAYTTPGGVPRKADGRSPKGPLDGLKNAGGSRVRFLDLDFKRDGKPAIDDKLEAVCLSRLVQAGIGDYFERSDVAPNVLDLVDVLPTRGQLGTFGRAGFTDLYTWVKASPQSAVLGAFQVADAFRLVDKHKLLGGWTTRRFELRHRDFVQEIGKEALLPG